MYVESKRSPDLAHYLPLNHLSVLPASIHDTVAVVIVTHDSQLVLDRCLAALAQQTVQPDAVAVVDSGSGDVGYLHPHGSRTGISVHMEANIGFSRANNIGYQFAGQYADFVLFLNPDAFPAPDSIEMALAFFSVHNEVGCIGGRLLGFDVCRSQPTGLIDSTGVFRKWYGCWHDRSQGEADHGQHGAREQVPAACGAFLLCRKTALEQAATGDGTVFDADFFLYKEDIELCLRIRKKGWTIMYLPEIIVHHCRGWQKNRRQVPHRLRMAAAASELLLYRKHPSPYFVWALAKYLLVRGMKI